jgi:hypothetical protein
MKNEETMSPNIIQKFSLADATSVEVDSYFYPDLCVSRECLMILRLALYQVNAL